MFFGSVDNFTKLLLYIAAQGQGLIMIVQKGLRGWVEGLTDTSFPSPRHRPYTAFG